jgi:hypothetical protein
LGEIRHAITRHRYRFTVAAAKVRAPANGCRWLRVEQMQDVPLSTAARKALSAIGVLAGRDAKRRLADSQRE